MNYHIPTEFTKMEKSTMLKYWQEYGTMKLYLIGKSSKVRITLENVW